MNTRCKSAFVACYGNVYEHSEWVAELAFDRVQGVDEAEEVARTMKECVDQAPLQVRLDLIRSHPDLADKAEIGGELTPESRAEQSSAGLDRCSPEEYARLNTLTRRYREKFGFPFVMAVRGSNRTDILNALHDRLVNDRVTEIETALTEVHKIAQLRLQSMDVAG